MFHMYDKKFISVMSHAFYPLPFVTNCHTFSDPLPLERDVLYGRPQRVYENSSILTALFIVSFLRQYISCDWKIVFLIIDIAMLCGRFGRLADLRNSFISDIKPKVETSIVKYSSVFELGLFTSF